MKRILVPIDDSYVSLIAAEKAVELAKQNDSEIRFISVVEVMGAIRYGEDGIGYVIDYTDINNKLIKDQTNILDKVIDKFYSSSVPFEKKILIGKPKEQILIYAEKENCDFIVIGCNSFSKVKKFFIGLITQHIILKAKCPVLIINETIN